MSQVPGPSPSSVGDGNGWVISADGVRRWGRYGAAGLLLRAPSPDNPAVPQVLLQHRAVWTASGDTWALTGGARDSHEDAAAAALRETEEEAGIAPGSITVRAEIVTSTMSGTTWSRPGLSGARVHQVLRSLRPDQKRPDPTSTAADFVLPPLQQESGAEVTWSYTTVIADSATALETIPNNESLELRWVPESEVADMPLMPAFAAAWETLRSRPVVVVVDVANVLGSRPTGWWKDRLGATEKLLDELAATFPRTLPLPGAGFGWTVAMHAVLEGQARGAEHEGPLQVHRAPGEGDDEIVAVAEAVGRAGGSGQGEQAQVVVVTADRGLRARLGSTVIALGPSQLVGK